ncbi:MAG: D-cysteine desulfhydrase family protein [Paraburkholderia sp.]|uniref:D-cysteine desulfhydrase family protein n=1 Tax=Paraburkholderia sp. TaxID=1926495 RepID=UPI003C5D1EBA
MAVAANIEFHRFPHVELLEGPTPIQKLDRLSASLGGVNIFVKRDDVMGLGGGGNKLRKLEFLVGQAIAQGADTIVTVGARQSNHARLTAAAAARAGLKCELVLTRAVPRTDPAYTDNGNILLNDLLGAVVHDLPGSANALEFAEARANELRALGRNVYVCPLGGSSPVGCLGYARCAIEIDQQAQQQGISFDEVVVPNGSGGTHAGLAAGFTLLGRGTTFVRGHAVLSSAERSTQITLEKTSQTLELMGASNRMSEADINISGEHLGDGYGIPTDSMRAAVRAMASTEGLLLDPVYGGKAFAGMIQDIEQGRYKPGQNVLFVMTGGIPGLYAYRSAF